MKVKVLLKRKYQGAIKELEGKLQRLSLSKDQYVSQYEDDLVQMRRDYDKSVEVLHENLSELKAENNQLVMEKDKKIEELNNLLDSAITEKDELTVDHSKQISALENQLLFMTNETENIQKKHQTEVQRLKSEVDGGALRSPSLPPQSPSFCFPETHEPDVFVNPDIATLESEVGSLRKERDGLKNQLVSCDQVSQHAIHN